MEIEKLKAIKTALGNLVDVAVKAGLVERISPPGKPLPKWTKDEVPVNEKEATAAIAGWDELSGETGCPVGILDAKQKGAGN